MGRNWSFAVRITAGFAMLASIILILAFTGTSALNRAHRDVETLADQYLLFSQQVQGSQLAIINLRRFEKDAFIHLAQPEKRQDYFARWEKSLAQARQKLKEAATIAAVNDSLRDSKLASLQQLEQELGRYEQGFRAVYQQVEQGQILDTISADLAIEPHKKAVSNAEKTIMALVDSINQEADKLQQELTDSTESASMLMLVVSLGSLLLAIALTATVVLSIRRPLGQIGELTRQLASERDLTLQLPDFGRNEIGQVGRSLNELIVTVRQLISESHQHSVRLVDAADHLGKVNHALNQASARQSEATTESAAAIEELTVSISQMADNASKVAEQASQASSAASHGQQQADRAVSQIEKIAQSLGQTASTIASLNQRSGEIDGIVRVISDIAEQTNLLALNAAIEAARAGETGRGFAVVADEVRKLAERTSQATSEINQRIQAVQQDTALAYNNMQQANALIDSGVEETRKVSAALAEIQSCSQASEQQVSEIASAIREQNLASQEVSANVEHIADMNNETRQSVASAAQLAEQLGRQSGELDASLARFRI